MTAMFADVIRTEEQLRAILGVPSHRVLAKHVGALDAHCRAFIAKSPCVLVASADREGALDISPKGDPQGFVRVLDDTTVAIPERPGNRKADTLSNLLQNTRVGLLFLVPGKQETLRISGTGTIVRDEWLRAQFVVRGKTPSLVLVVRVEEVFFHCAKWAIRSNVWSPAHWPDISGLPTLAQAMVDAGRLAETPAEMQARIDQDIRQRLY
jgi:PPOX class probable FMN-dependent enzyme